MKKIIVCLSVSCWFISALAQAERVSLECDLQITKTVYSRVTQTSRSFALIQFNDVPPIKFVQSSGGLEIMIGTHTSEGRDESVQDLSDATKWHLTRKSQGLVDSILIDRATGRLSYNSKYEGLGDEVVGICKKVDTSRLKF